MYLLICVVLYIPFIDVLFIVYADWLGSWEHSQDGRTPLMHAACNNYEDCVQLLLDAGADKDIKTTFVRVFCL